MNFLAGLREAMAQGIAKDDYMAIWNKEMEQKSGNSETQSNILQDLRPADIQSDEACTEKNVVSLLMEISKQQSKVQMQQDKIQQQLKDLQASHENEQLKMQQQFERTQNSLSEKVSALETTLANLNKSFTDCMRRSVHSESLDIQENLSVMTETLYNHMLDEMRNVLAGKASSVNKTLFNSTMKDINTACQISHQSAAEGTAEASDKTTLDIDSDNINDHDSNDSVHEGQEVPLLKVYEEDTKNDFTKSDTETSFRHTLHSELNTFLVNVQKLLLRPINSEDMSFYITERIKDILQYDRNITTDQLLSVQTAISADVHARLYKMEMNFKQELGKIGSTCEHNEQLVHDIKQMLAEIKKLKNFLSSELPTILTSQLKLVSVPDKTSFINLDEREINELGYTKDIKHGDTQQSTKIRHLEKEMHSESDLRSEGNDDSHKNLCSLGNSNEQAQAIILMLSMYILMFLIYRDALFSKRTLPNSKTSEIDPKPKKKKKEKVQSESSKKPVGTEHVFVPQQKADNQHLTDAHLKLLFGQYKETQYLCHLNYSKLSVGEDVFFQLSDIAPGYNVQLRANILEDKGNLNFFIQSVCGKQDDSLIWPASFNITLMLEDKQHLAGFKKDNWQMFTKMKALFKPIKSKGHSTPIPLCYFRDDVINKCIHEGSVHFTISIRFIGDEQKDTTDEF